MKAHKMYREETYEEKKLRVISEKNNPYAEGCPNRHLWSEGFRYGYNHLKKGKLTDCSCGKLGKSPLCLECFTKGLERNNTK